MFSMSLLEHFLSGFQLAGPALLLVLLIVVAVAYTRRDLGAKFATEF